MLEITEELGTMVETRADCDLYSSLYKMNKRYLWPRRRHLKPGVAPLAGLPKWGHSMYTLVAPWARPHEDSFTYHGEEFRFVGIEHDLPTLDRMDTECDSPSEFDYEFDETGWATGNEPDWS